MPVYEITHPTTGVTIEMEGPTAPSEGQIRAAFSAIGKQPSAPPSNDPASYPQGKSTSEAERMRREFVRTEGTLATRVRNTPASEILPNIAKEVPRLAQEVITVPLSSAKKSLYGLGALAKTGGSLLRGNDLDTALRTGTEAMQGFTPIQGPLESSMTGELVGRGIENLQGAAETATGNTGFAKAGIEAGADILGLVGGGKAAIRGGRSLATLGRKGVDTAIAAIPEKVATPESLARSALKPYIGDSAARNRMTAKGLDTFLNDRNAVANPKTFLEKNVAEMEQVVGRQNILLNQKGNVRADISPIEQSLTDFVNESRATPGTADASVQAAEKVLSDIKNHPDFNPTDNTIGVNTAQTMKKNIWKFLKEKGAFSKDANSMLNDAMWSSADGMAKIVNDVIPEMATENARYGELANLNKMLTRSVNRITNNNLVSLSTAIQLVRGDFKGLATAAAVKTIDHPTFKSYLAQRMARAKKRPVSANEVKSAIQTIKNNIGNAIMTQRGEQPSQDQ